jgi:hypothetical protein
MVEIAKVNDTSIIEKFLTAIDIKLLLKISVKEE